MTRNRLEELVMLMQGAFLDNSALHLTVHDAQRRFAVDDTTCQAVLGALVGAGVLTTTADGRYARFFPRRAQSHGTRAAA
jgi:hypothetical protein